MRTLIGGTIPIIFSVVWLGCSGSTEPVKQTVFSRGVVSIDTAVGYLGTDVDVKLRLQLYTGIEAPLDSLGGFEFLICYDASSLRFISATKLDSAISKWEYFSYRMAQSGGLIPDSLGLVRIVAIRNLNNGIDPSPPQFQPQGAIATLHFFVSTDRKVLGTSPEVGFCLQECRDNTISPDVPTGPLYSPDTSLGRIKFMEGYDTMSCPRGYSLSPVLEFRGGWIRIPAPSDDPLGDIDLNGVAYEIKDAVLFSNYFHYGYSVFDPVAATRQIANTDCDRDGVPLTVSDLDSMIRNIGGNGHDPDTVNVPYRDTLWIFPRQAEGNSSILAFKSTTQIDEVWLRFTNQLEIPFRVQYLGDTTVSVSTHKLGGTWTISCGATGGRKMFGPELGDRFQLWTTTNGDLNIVTAQASRYPGVSMVVKLGPSSQQVESFPYVVGP